MTYYEAYSSCKTEDEIIEMAKSDARRVIFFGLDRDQLKIIEYAMNKAIADKRVEEREIMETIKDGQ